MFELNLLGLLHPGLKCGKTLEVEFREAGRAIDWYDLLYTGQRIDPALVYLFCLLSALSGKAVREFCLKLGIPPRMSRMICDEGRIAHDVQRRFCRRLEKNKPPQNSEIYHWLKPLTTEALLYLMARCEKEEIRQWISFYYTRLRIVTTSVDGKDLEKLGVVPGPHFRKILDSLLDARLNNRVTNRQEELALVKKRFSKFINN